MFIHMSLHYPIHGKETFIIESMKRYGAAMEGNPGHREAHILRDTKTGKLIGMAIWDTKEQWEAAYPTLEQAVRDDPFHEWEEMPPKVYHLEEV